ncbi:hypothetical protein [Rubritalea sp.]|uniref:hypothetical protein n=1 Tax=Rubritalea sp. TaxID=2109375 RepID=UPI003EF78D34
MSDKPGYQLNHEYLVIQPESGEAYPILCSDWDHIKSEVISIKTSFQLYHTLGSIFLGASITSFISIISGAYPSNSNNTTTIVIAWSVTICCLVIGAFCLHFANETKQNSNKQAEQIISQMEIIEKKFKKST